MQHYALYLLYWTDPLIIPETGLEIWTLKVIARQ